MKRNSCIWQLTSEWQVFLLQKASSIFRSVIDMHGYSNILILLMVFRCLWELRCVRFAASGK